MDTDITGTTDTTMFVLTELSLHNRCETILSFQSNRRIDVDDVLDMVDCGGSDLGFCDMSANYPGHMMGNIMSECQEAVYRGFVPIPEDLELLGGSGGHGGRGDSGYQKFSNSSK